MRRGGCRSLKSACTQTLIHRGALRLGGKGCTFQNHEMDPFVEAPSYRCTNQARSPPTRSPRQELSIRLVRNIYHIIIHFKILISCIMILTHQRVSAILCTRQYVFQPSRHSLCILIGHRLSNLSQSEKPETVASFND